MSWIKLKMRKEGRGKFCFTFSKEKLEQTYNLSPEMRLTWLEEANEFVNTFLSKEKRKIWERLSR